MPRFERGAPDMLQASMNIEVEFVLDEATPALTASAALREGCRNA